MDALSLTRHAVSQAEMEYNVKFGHTLGRIHHISIVIRIDICYTVFHLGTQTVVTTIPYFQGLKHSIKYLDSHPNDPYIVIIILIMAQNSPYLHGVGIKLKTTQPIIFWNAIKLRIII